jgi:hypothetical protein
MDLLKVQSTIGAASTDSESCGISENKMKSMEILLRSYMGRISDLEKEVGD